MRTVNVEWLEEYPVVRMVWARELDLEHVESAFHTVTTLLNTRREATYVLVDLSANPQFPMLQTVSGALFGPHTNPYLKEWLVVGANAAAKQIGRVVTNISGKHKIQWFDTQDEALAYVDFSAAENAV